MSIETLNKSYIKAQIKRILNSEHGKLSGDSIINLQFRRGEAQTNCLNISEKTLLKLESVLLEAEEPTKKSDDSERLTSVEIEVTDKQAWDYISEFVREKLSEQGIEVDSFAFQLTAFVSEND